MVVQSSRYECSVAAWDKARIDVLAAVDLTPVIAGCAVEDTDTILLRRRRPVRHETVHFHGLIRRSDRKALGRIHIRCLPWTHIEELQEVRTHLCLGSRVVFFGLLTFSSKRPGSRMKQPCLTRLVFLRFPVGS